jgi:ribonucleoside-diphosphate reductase alpha chain
MARIHSLSDMKACVELATALLVAGTVYSDVPYLKVVQIRTQNRRLGLGLMGIHEWLILHGKKYGPDNDLAEYLRVYEQSTHYAHQYEDKWNLSYSAKTRAIAPTGTISICAETTSGLEPIFCSAYKRRYLNKTKWEYQYVIDPIVKRLVDSGVSPDDVEDAYVLAKTPERRIEFQSWLQQYVDHGISSTLNIPTWGSDSNNESKVQDFGDMLMRYLPRLRGVTCYPDGARSGQPLTTIPFDTAVQMKGQIFEEQGDVCELRGGSCGV